MISILTFATSGTISSSSASSFSDLARTFCFALLTAVLDTLVGARLPENNGQLRGNRTCNETFSAFALVRIALLSVHPSSLSIDAVIGPTARDTLWAVRPLFLRIPRLGRICHAKLTFCSPLTRYRAARRHCALIKVSMDLPCSTR